MQNGLSETWWAGFSSASPSSLPMKKLPPGIWIILAGQPTGAADRGRDARARCGGHRRGDRVRPRSGRAPTTRAREEHGAADRRDGRDAEPDEEAHLARRRAAPGGRRRRARRRRRPAAAGDRQLGIGRAPRPSARSRCGSVTRTLCAGMRIGHPRSGSMPQRLPQRAPELARRLPPLRRLDLRRLSRRPPPPRRSPRRRRCAAWDGARRCDDDDGELQEVVPVERLLARRRAPRAMSASAKTSVHGPVEPVRARELLRARRRPA